jgi:hypothetical protein
MRTSQAFGGHTFDAQQEAHDVTGYGDLSPRFVAGLTHYAVDGYPLSRDLFFALADYFGILDKPAAPAAAEIATVLAARGIILPDD